jgi:hypothetical protein
MTDIDRKKHAEEKDKAYGILGVKPEASKDDIERRYFVLLKKHNAFKSLGQTPDFDMEQVTKSYDLLMGYEGNEGSKKTSSAGNFLYYYKWTIIAVIAGILCLVSLIKVVTRPRPDLEIALLGNLGYFEDTGTGELADYIESSIEVIKQVAVSNATAISENPDFLIPQKEAAIVAGRYIDIFIVDRSKYEYYSKAGLFISLDDYSEDLGADKTGFSDLMRSVDADVDNEQHLFGVYVSNKKVLEKLNNTSEKLIAGISCYSKRPEVAAEVLKLLTEP